LFYVVGFIVRRPPQALLTAAEQRMAGNNP